MANYKGAVGQAQSSELLGTIVHGYLTMRLSLTKTAVINAAVSPKIKKLSVQSHLRPSVKYGIYCTLFHDRIDAYIPTSNFAIYRTYFHLRQVNDFHYNFVYSDVPFNRHFFQEFIKSPSLLLPKEPLIGHFKHGRGWLKCTAVLGEVRLTFTGGVLLRWPLVIFKPLQ